MLSAPSKLALMFVATCGKLGCNMLTLHFRHLDLLERLTCWGEFLKVDCRKSKSLHLRWILAISVSQIPPIHTRSVEPHTVVVAGGGRWDLPQVHMGRASSRTLRSC